MLPATRVSRGIALGAAAAGALGLTVASAIIGATSPIVDHPALFVTLRSAGCLGLLAIALTMGLRGASGRMAGAVVMSAGLLALAGFTAADAPLAFAVGRIAVSLGLLMIVYTCFAYPAGRVEDRPARRFMAASTSAIGVLLAANLLLSNVPPVSGPFTRCSGSACPANPLNVISVSPNVGQGLSISLALVTAGALAVTAVMLARRAVRATALQRRSLVPLLAWASTTALAYGFFVTVRALDQHAPLLTPGAVVVAAIIAAMPLALALGIARGRVFAMAAVEHLIAGMESRFSLAALQQTMADAFGDPALQLVLWDAAEGRYVDARGHPVELASGGADRRVAHVSHGGEELAAVVHDPLLPGDVVDAAIVAIRLALDNARLQLTLSASIRALEASRQRVARAADEERRRIENDLHDGAQQGLIDLRIRLQRLEEIATTDPRGLASGLADAGRRVQVALDDIRNLAHGIYPSELGDLGLAYALAELVRKVPVHVSLHTAVRGRFPAEAETAVYFCCVEALQNVAKHCGAQARADLSLVQRPDGLHFTLVDAGPGFDLGSLATSHGITRMRDRLEAVGGRLMIESSPGRGSTLRGQVPVTER